MLEKIVAKPFDKESELAQLKKDVSKLEREISIKIQENQMKQLDAAQDISVDVNEVPFVKIEANKPKALLPKKLVNEGKVNKLRV